MITLLLRPIRLLPYLVGGHRQLALENLTLRQQLAVYKRTSITRCPGQKLHSAVAAGDVARHSTRLPLSFAKLCPAANA